MNELRSEMSKPMKRSAFFLSAAMVACWLFMPRRRGPATTMISTQEIHRGKAKGSQNKQGQGMNHEGMDHGSMEGMDHGSMKGMDHGSMEGMDHDKMMESHGSDKAKAGKDGQ
jgi:uncharacterized protein involved in copper resistance